MTPAKLEDAERVAELLDCFQSDRLVLTEAADLLRQIPELKNSWRCYYCGEVCRSEVDARNHFGSPPGSETACQIKQAGEFALLQALRNAEDQLSRYRSEDSDTQRAMYSMQSDHQQALRREEERGYAKGVADMRKEVEELRQQLSEREWMPIETAPKDGSFILGFPIVSFFNGERVEIWGAVRWSSIDGEWHALRSPHRPALTHWQPLPGAPK